MPLCAFGGLAGYSHRLKGRTDFVRFFAPLGMKKLLRRFIKIGLPLLALGLCVGLFVHSRNANARLRQQIAAAGAQREQTAHLRAENQRLQALVEQTNADEGDGLRAIHAEAVQARNEVADLERRAEERYAAKVAKDRAAAEALAANRDMTKGPMLIDNCANVGRGTPADTLQTLIWASLKGDDEAVASMIGLDGKTRTAVAALLAVLPQNAREKYPTSEKMAALVLADMLLNVSVMRVVNQSVIDSQRTVLTVGGLSDKTIDIVMEQGTNGWQVATADRKIFEQFKAKILGAPASPAKK